MRLTAKQRDALAALGTEQRRVFVLEYVANSGNATAAARVAQYSEASIRSIASELLTFPDVQAAIEALRNPGEDRKYRSIEQLREQWDAWTDEGSFEPKDRIKASELLGKSTGALDIKVRADINVNAPTTDAEARTRIEALVSKLGGRVVWDEKLIESGEEDGGHE